MRYIDVVDRLIDIQGKFTEMVKNSQVLDKFAEVEEDDTIFHFLRHELNKLEDECNADAIENLKKDHDYTERVSE